MTPWMSRVATTRTLMTNLRRIWMRRWATITASQVPSTMTASVQVTQHNGHCCRTQTVTKLMAGYTETSGNDLVGVGGPTRPVIQPLHRMAQCLPLLPSKALDWVSRHNSQFPNLQQQLDHDRIIYHAKIAGEFSSSRFQLLGRERQRKFRHKSLACARRALQGETLCGHIAVAHRHQGDQICPGNHQP